MYLYGSSLYVTPPTSGVSCGGGGLPVAACCLPTVKDKDANMAVVRTTITKRFKLSTFELLSSDAPSRKQPLKRKASGDDHDSGFPEVSIDITVTSLKPIKQIGDEDVRLAFGQTSVNVQAPPELPASAIDDLLAGSDAAGAKPEKKAKKPAGGTWSAKHFLR